jgi:pyruvate dehydrogenase (quinone)
MPGVFETAIRVAVAERGVSVIVLPGDVALMESPPAAGFLHALLPARPLLRPRDSELDTLANMLNDASRCSADAAVSAHMSS